MSDARNKAVGGPDRLRQGYGESAEAIAKAEGPPYEAAPATPPRTAPPSTDKVLCERCGTEMFRMHAVWRCPSCGYKTDCCGW